MKQRIGFILSAAIILLLSANSFAQGFEGIIKMEMTSPKMGDSKMTMTTYIKGDKSMTEMNMPQGSMKVYMDQKTHKSIMVMEAMKMGMEMNTADAQEIAKKHYDTAASAIKVEETSERKAISGHSCQLFRVTMSNGDQSNWWMTNEVPKSVMASLKNLYNNGWGKKKVGPNSEAIEAMFKKGLAPIQIETVRDGKSEATITFVQYEQKDIENSMFKIADDIKIQQMPAMGGMGKQ
jgi:hypothetical protein